MFQLRAISHSPHGFSQVNLLKRQPHKTKTLIKSTLYYIRFMIHEEISLLSFYSFQQASFFEHLKSKCIIEHHRRKLFKNSENPISSHEKVLIPWQTSKYLSISCDRLFHPQSYLFCLQYYSTSRYLYLQKICIFFPHTIYVTLGVHL